MNSPNHPKISPNSEQDKEGNDKQIMKKKIKHLENKIKSIQFYNQYYKRFVSNNFNIFIYILAK